MSTLDELKPVQKLLVMDLLNEAGFDVSQWKNYKGSNPAANPKYCYNWSFEQAGEAIAVCLWHQSLKEKQGAVVYHRKARAIRAVGELKAFGTEEIQILGRILSLPIGKNFPSE